MTKAADRFFRAGGFKNAHAVCIAMVTALLVLLPACGKKAPPIPQTYVEPPVVEKIQTVLENSMAKIRWPVPEWEGKDENALSGFYVYRSQIALSEKPCEDCPVLFKKAADIRIKSNKSDASYSERLEKGFRYSFKVSVYTDSGYEGEKSDIVTVEY